MENPEKRPAAVLLIDAVIQRYRNQLLSEGVVAGPSPAKQIYDALVEAGYMTTEEGTA